MTLTAFLAATFLVAASPAYARPTDLTSKLPTIFIFCSECSDPDVVLKLIGICPFQDLKRTES
jgi:hypothetical protein